jgi:hypothetical protein
MSESVDKLVGDIALKLKEELKDLPEEFYSSFKYTTTCRTYSHPVTLGLLAKVLWSLPDTGYVGIDVRLNKQNEAKFQPDLVIFDGSLERELLYVDYESPNSCDQRIPAKDVGAYYNWRVATAASAPYLLVTTLPASPVDSWELRYAGNGERNNPFRGRLAELRANPYKFWYSYYATEVPPAHRENVYFINIEGRAVRPVDWANFGV